MQVKSSGFSEDKHIKLHVCVWVCEAEWEKDRENQWRSSSITDRRIYMEWSWAHNTNINYHTLVHILLLIQYVYKLVAQINTMVLQYVHVHSNSNSGGGGGACSFTVPDQATPVISVNLFFQIRWTFTVLLFYIYECAHILNTNQNQKIVMNVSYLWYTLFLCCCWSLFGFW